MNNPFWDYSLVQYAREGVSAACLTLQDEHDLDVNVLLYAAWLASMQQNLSAEHLNGLQECIKPWREQVVRPLRDLRRLWRGVQPAQALREQLKALELQAERDQQEQMLVYYRAAPALPAVGAALAHNLNMAVACSAGNERSRNARSAHLAALLRT